MSKIPPAFPGESLSYPLNESYSLHLLSTRELILIIELSVYANSDFKYLPQLKMENFFRSVVISTSSCFSC